MNPVTRVARSVEPAASRGQALAGGKYLTFALDDEEYGVPVLAVREIIKIQDITAVPQLPPWVKGVINLRGKVIPVVDLRLRFELATREYTERTCIIVVDVAARSHTVMIGMVVDAVCDVICVSDDELAEPPAFEGPTSHGYIQALAKVKGTVKILLNLDRMLGTDGELVRAI